MPITKVPVIHKFGIISHNQRLELQQRLIRKTYEESHPTNRSVGESKRNPLEVTDTFVKAFNEAATFSEKQKWEGTAEVMLERLKRKAGVRSGGTNCEEDLDSAWTDLAALVQCRGRIQEEALDILITTLDQAPLEPSLIPGVFFLAETALYWLRTEAMQSPYLRTWEIKLLKVGHMVFMRLYYYHMVGYLQSCRAFKNRLYTYLQGLPEYQSIYSSYPNAHLYLRYIIEVGNILLSDDDLDPGDVKESDMAPALSNTGKTAETEGTLREATTTHAAISGPTVTAVPAAATLGSVAVSEETDRNSNALVTLSHSVHDLAPTLWHSLDVWRCCHQCADEVGVALTAVVKCGAGLPLESWIDTACALVVLGEAAKLRLDVLKVLQRLAQGEGRPSVAARMDSNHSAAEQPKMTTRRSTAQHCPDAEAEDGQENENDPGEFARSTKLSARSQWNDTARRPSVGTTTADMDQRMRELTPVTYANSPAHPGDDSNGGLPAWRWEVSCVYAEALCSVVLHGATSSIQKRALMGSHTTVESLRLQEGLRESAGLLDLLTFNPAACRENHHRDGQKPLEEPSGTGDQPLASDDADQTSGAQHERPAGELRQDRMQESIDSHHPQVQPDSLASHVTQQAEEQPSDFTDMHRPSHDNDDWSWRIRYSAVQCLVHICRCLRDDDNRSGLRQAAFSALLRVQNYFERDSRVLEALKVGQAGAKIEDALQGKSQSHNVGSTKKHSDISKKAAHSKAAESKSDHLNASTIGTKIARALSQRYLPALLLRNVRAPTLPRSSPSSSPAKQERHNMTAVHGSLSPRAAAAGALRTTLKEELTFSTIGAAHSRIPDFTTRTNIDLRRIVEDQWRKELHQQLQDEEDERLRQVEEKRQAAQSKTKEPHRQQSLAETKDSSSHRQLPLTAGNRAQ